MRKIILGRHFFTLVVSVFLSVFAVTVVAYGASLVNTSSVGSGTSTPGAALGVKGAAIIEGFVWGTSFTATSTGFIGVGTSTPGAALGVKGGILVEDFVHMSSFAATSTTATSTIRTGMTLASTTVVDRMSGAWAIGTTTIADADVAGTMAIDPSFTVGAAGSADNATSTVYLAGEGGNGGQIILRSSNGANCISIMADSVTNAVGATALQANDLLSVDVVECPR